MSKKTTSKETVIPASLQTRIEELRDQIEQLEQLASIDLPVDFDGEIWQEFNLDQTRKILQSAMAIQETANSTVARVVDKLVNHNLVE